MGSVGRNRAVAILLDPTSRSINSDVVTDGTKYCRCPRLLLPTAETMPLLNSIPAQVKPLVIVSVATTVVLLSVVSYSHLKRMIPVNTKRLRVKLPKNLALWRSPGEDVDDEDSEAIWRTLDPLLRQHGLEQWIYGGLSYLDAPGDSVRMPRGYAYIGPSRASGEGNVGTARSLSRMQYLNATFRIVRTKDGHDVTVRPIRLGNEGIEHLRILRKIATGPLALLSNNHTLPMAGTIDFEDVTLGIFPLTGNDMDRAFKFWPKNSVGDVVDMILQALEGLAFLHEQRIAHRDANISNFVVEYHPESLRTMTVATSRPRVYIVDFETSVAFPEELPFESCVCVGVPTGETITEWARALPPEVTSRELYSPFKLDVWQFGYSFTGSYTYRTTIAVIDDILINLVNDDVGHRPSAKEALSMLRSVVSKMAPIDLLIPPTVTR
ncbi:hypothetical protein QCA50_005278 [Cerrena zonata]|uniref:Protein kinase domain-containing protein n=1 Tax=Cerrena zonata TaxID=2478898 RepID=A0AAW0GJB1_9APHY